MIRFNIDCYFAEPSGYISMQTIEFPPQLLVCCAVSRQKNLWGLNDSYRPLLCSLLKLPTSMPGLPVVNVGIQAASHQGSPPLGGWALYNFFILGKPWTHPQPNMCHACMLAHCTTESCHHLNYYLSPVRSCTSCTHVQCLCSHKVRSVPCCSVVQLLMSSIHSSASHAC